ncbi:MAG: flagellar basal body rod protein FlgB [Syntrophaceticus sp.]
MVKNLGDPLISILKSALDVNWLRQQAINQNIANVDTPNYKRTDVNFKNILEKKNVTRGLCLNRTNCAHLNGNSKEKQTLPLVHQTETRNRNDGNNVVLEQENALMAETLLQYQFLTRLTTEHLDMLRMAITEGRR